MSFFRKAKPQANPQYLIVGLGNPGPEYRGTRHNIGFDVVDSLAKQSDIAVKTSVHQSLVGTGWVGGAEVCLVKPLTFMNLSGRAVVALAKKYGIPPERTLVIADDLDLPVGKVRMRAKGSAGGHNGHKSVIQSLGTTEYPRLKIGIGKGGETIDHVLSRFTPGERKDIDEAVARSVKATQVWVEEGIEKAMLFANSGASNED